MIFKFKEYKESFFWLMSSFLLAPYFYFRIFLRKNKKNDNLKILIIQTAKIGDMVCTTPIFREMKIKYFQCHLSVLINSRARGVLENNPYLDEIIMIDDLQYKGIKGKLKLIKKLRKKHFDWSFVVLPGIFLNIIPFWSWIPNRILTTTKYLGEMVKILSIFGNYRLEYKRHTYTTTHYLKLLIFLGIKSENEKREIFINFEEEKKASDFLQDNSLSQQNFLIGICVTAGNKIKEWSKKKYAQLADELVRELKAKIIFIGSSNDKEDIQTVRQMMQEVSFDCSGIFSLNEIPALIKNLKIFISGDCGPLYIASAVGVPVIDIAGPIDVTEQPPKENSVMVQKKLDCAPCSFMIPPARFCKWQNFKCLNMISTQDVFEAVKILIVKQKINL